jgi:uncharacterized protein YegP (UPF0339 family)
MRFDVIQAQNGAYFFRLVAPNGQIIASSEMYRARDDCLRAIEYVKASGQAPKTTQISYQTCFISYSAKDTAFAEKLYQFLSKNGVSTWFAPKDLEFGAKTRVALDEAISTRDRLIVVLSTNSIASHWVEKEVESAFEQERQTDNLVLLPVALDNSAFEAPHGWAADLRRTRNIGSFADWTDDDKFLVSADRLLRALRADGT